MIETPVMVEAPPNLGGAIRRTEIGEFRRPPATGCFGLKDPDGTSSASRLGAPAQAC